MISEIPEDDEFFRIENIAYDVAQIFGSTTDQGIGRARRCVYRAALYIGGHDRRWTWLKTKDSFFTTLGTREYSLRDDTKQIHQVWIQGTNRQRIDRMPTSQFVERVPNPELATGIPTLFDEEGVDSGGARIISLYPVPNGALEIFYRFTRRLMPFKDPTNDIRVLWGMPPEMLDVLTQKAAALAVQGISSSRFADLNMMAEQMIQAAYADDQAHPATTYRAPLMEGRDAILDGPMLPPQFGRD